MQLTSNNDSRRQRATLLILAMMLSACCATPTRNFDASICPPIAEYDETWEQQLAAELAAMPNDAAAVRAIIDYGELRAQLRECL
jgi:hypothetical protein